MGPRIAVLVPCLNESLTIGRVIDSVAQSLPEATVFVYDNGSVDDTSVEAKLAGAVVRHVAQRGKGSVVLRMFADVEADIYVIIDGDDTYDASMASELVRCMTEGNADMVVAVRTPVDRRVFPRGHYLGNRFFSLVVQGLFGNGCCDVFSGFRVLSRRFVKSFPVNAIGFEIETEMTVHAIDLRVPIVEVPSLYRERPDGSASKLRTMRDGSRILWAIGVLLVHRRPRWLCVPVGMLSLVFWGFGWFSSSASGLWCVEATLFLGTVLALESSARARRDVGHLMYLREPSVTSVGCANDVAITNPLPNLKSDEGAAC